MINKLQPKWWTLAAIGAGTFMSALDGSIVNTILPVLRADFQSNIAAIQWVSLIYLLMLSSLLLTFGRLGDLRGHKLVYSLGFGVFILGSALCGIAWSSTALIAFRGLQAIGGAMLASNSPAIITSVFPTMQRGRAFGLIAMMTYLGLTAGPSFGGWLAQEFGWRAVFYVNVPVGALALLLSMLFIPKHKPVDHEQPFDLLGATIFSIGLTAILLGMNKGADWGWTSPAIAGLFIGALVLFLLFLRIEKRSTSPMLDVSLFHTPLFSMSVIGAFLNYICISSITFLMPFFLIQGRDLGSAQAGLILTAQPIIMAITAPVSGALSDRLGSRGPGMLGMGVLAVGLFFLSRLGADTPLGMIVLPLAMTGLGTGIFISPNTSALMGSAPGSRQGIASGVQAAARNVGMVMGIGLAGAILTTHITNNIPSTLFRGIQMSFLVVSGIAVLGIFTSAAKEK